MLMLFGKQFKAVDFAIVSLLLIGAFFSLYQWQSTVKLAERLFEKQQRFNEMKAVADAVQRMPSVTLPSNSQLTRAEVQKVLNRYALKPSVVKESSGGEINLRFEAINFNQLLQILPVFQRAFIAVEAIEIEKTERAGFVRAKLVLIRLV